MAVVTDNVTFEMSGDTPHHLWRYKEDFFNDMKKWGYKHTSLTKETDMLVASSENFIDKEHTILRDDASNKCKKAQKYGIPIYTYEEAFNRKEALHTRIIRKKKILNLGFLQG